jgi:hypothetical protein
MHSAQWAGCLGPPLMPQESLYIRPPRNTCMSAGHSRILSAGTTCVLHASSDRLNWARAGYIHANGSAIPNIVDTSEQHCCVCATWLDYTNIV